MKKNFVNLEGRIVNKISFSEHKKGAKIATFTLAVSDFFKVKDKDKNEYVWKERRQFIPVVAFESKLIKNLETNISSKDLVNLTGKIEYKTYQDENKDWKTYFAVVPKTISLAQKFQESINDKKQSFSDPELKETDDILLYENSSPFSKDAENDEWLMKMYKTIIEEDDETNKLESNKKKSKFSNSL